VKAVDQALTVTVTMLANCQQVTVNCLGLKLEERERERKRERFTQIAALAKAVKFYWADRKGFQVR